MPNSKPIKEVYSDESIVIMDRVDIEEKLKSIKKSRVRLGLKNFKERNDVYIIRSALRSYDNMLCKRIKNRIMKLTGIRKKKRKRKTKAGNDHCGDIPGKSKTGDSNRK